MRIPRHPIPLHDTPAGQRLVEVGLCLMVTVVPLVLMPGTYEYGRLPKMLALHVCVAIACVGWVIQKSQGRNLQPSPLTIPAFCWMGAVLLSALSTVHPLNTAAKTIDQAALIILFFVTARALPFDRLASVGWFSALAGLAAAVIGILQYHNLGFLGIPTNAPPSATFANRNLAAEYLICNIPLSVLLFLTAETRLAVWASGLSSSLMAVFLVYTRTRGAWVGAAGALLCIVVALALRPALRGPIVDSLRPRMDRSRGRWGLGFLVLFLLLSFLPPLHPPVPEEGMPPLPTQKSGVLSTAASIFQKEEQERGDRSKTDRLSIWRATLGMVADRPLMGLGPGGWVRAYPPYEGEGKTLFARSPFNDYLWIASEHGLIGLGIYFWLVVTGFRCLLRMARGRDADRRLAALAFAASLLAILGAACFDYPKDQPQTALFPYLLFGFVASATAGERRKPALSNAEGDQGPGLPFRLSPFAFRLLPCLCLVTALVGVECSRRRIAFDRHYFRAFSWCTTVENWPAALSEARQALAYGAFLPEALFYEGYALHHLGRYQEAEAAYVQSLRYAPHAWYAHKELGLLYLTTGRLQEASTHLLTVSSLYPQAADNHNNLGVLYERTGDLDRAEREFRTALANEPGNPETHLNLGNAHRLRGQLDSAAVHYQLALRTNPDMPQAHLYLAQVLLPQGRFQDAVAHYRKVLQTDADDFDANWGLGLAFEASLHPQEAEVAYRKVQALNPAYPPAHLALAGLVHAQGRYREALAFYQSYLALGPDDTANVRLARTQGARCEEHLKR